MKTFLVNLLMSIFFIVLNIHATKANTKKTYKFPEHPHTIKLNLFSFATQTFQLQYEFSFNKNMSVLLGAKYMIPFKFNLQSFLGNDNFNSTGVKLGKFVINGYALTPEFRFYPGKKEEHKAPHGFYIAPFLRFGRYSVSNQIIIPSDTASGFNGGPVDLKLVYNGVGGGLMFGVQWVFKNRLSIDWWIVGGHYGTSSTTLSVTGDLLDQIGATKQVKSDLDEFFKENEIPFNPSAIINIQSQTLSGTISGVPYIGLRSGLCIGYNF